MTQRAEVWVTCRATLEIPCGPYDLSTSFEQLAKSAQAEARAKLGRIRFEALGAMYAHPRIVGLPSIVGYRADLEGAIPFRPSPLNELERVAVCGRCKSDPCQCGQTP